MVKNHNFIHACCGITFVMIFLILLGALCWDWLFSEPPSFLHPTVWMGNYIKNFWKLNHIKKPLFDFLWGILLVGTGLFLFTFPVLFLDKIIGNTLFVFNILISIPLLKVSFSMKYLFIAAKEIQKALEQDNLDEARRLTKWHLVSRNTSELSREDVVSAVVESVSENITDSFISPLFFYLIAGIPGAWGYRFINTCDAMIAYRNNEYEWGGKFTAWMDSALNYLTSRLSGLGITAAAAILHGVSGKNAYSVMLRNHSMTASPNAGWTMSAMAGALGVRLEKKGEYILQGGDKSLNEKVIQNCLRLTLLSLAVTMLFLILIYLGVSWAVNMAV